MLKNSTKHLFHLVAPSAWPLLTSFAAFFLVSGMAFYMHQVSYGGYALIFGLLCVLYCVTLWFNDIIDESTYAGHHTLAVRQGLRIGFILFVVSE